MKIRVLVAEDHPLVREGVIRALERDPGIEVIGEADNGITAMELARQLKPDVMVLDLRMPGLGGAVVLERLRAELPEIRALVMTANESPESLLDAVAAGAAGYLSKSLGAAELVARIVAFHDREQPRLVDDEPAVHTWPGQVHGLSEREAEMLTFIVRGLTNEDIAARAYLSIHTVKTYIRTAYRKIGVTSRSQAVAWGFRNGFESTDETGL